MQEASRPVEFSPEATSQQEWDAQRVQWLGRYAVADYRAHGSRDVKWDLGAATPENGNVERLTRCLETLSKRPHADFWLYLVTRLMANEHDWLGQEDEGKKVRAQAWRHGLASVSLPEFADRMERVLLAELFPPTRIGWYAGPLEPGDFAALATSEDGSPWLRHAMVGLHHLALASSAPLRPWPAAVSVAYMDHVRTAEHHLGVAYGLKPHYPEAAAAMIVVRMMEPGEKTRRQWFIKSLRFANKSAGNPRHIWSHPKIVARFEQLAAGTIEAQPGTLLAEHMEFGRFMTAWAAGRYRQAAAGSERLGRRLDTRWLDLLQVDAETMAADLKAVSGGR